MSPSKMDHQTKTLSESANGYVGYCACCDRYNVGFNNSLFIFSDSEFSGFMQILSERAGITPFYTSHGKEVIAETPMKNYFLVFSESEVDELLEMMVQSSLIVETNFILKQNGCRDNAGNQ